MLVSYIYLYLTFQILQPIQKPPTSIWMLVMMYHSPQLTLWNQIIPLSHNYPTGLVEFERLILIHRTSYVSRSLHLFHLRS